MPLLIVEIDSEVPMVAVNPDRLAVLMREG